MTNFGRVTAAVLDEVITRLTQLRDGDGFSDWDLCDCAAVLMGDVPADGDGFTFTSGWAHDDSVDAEAQR